MKDFRTTTIDSLIKINYTNYGYAMIILIAIGLIASFINFMQCDAYGLSVFKLVLLGFTDTMDESVIWIFRRFFVVCITFMAMQIVECLLFLIVKDIFALIVGCASMVLNTAITIMIIILSFSAIDELVVLGHNAWIKPLPFVMWVLVYILMLAACIIMFWWIYKQNRRRNIYEDDDGVIVEEIYRR